jgi:hypothetical protein
MTICRLCLQKTKLVNSHFIPKAVFKALRSLVRKNSNPVLVTEKALVSTSYQFDGWLLCSDCEDRFSKGGETWMIPRLANKTKFMLLEAVRKGPIAGRERTSTFHSCSATRELDLEKLTYFAVSIFWRAAVKDWAKGLETIDLGIYESDIRKWLLGETGYPMNVFLSVCLAEEAEDICHILPPFKLAARPFHTFYMFLPGVEFMLFVGKSVPKELQEHCVYSGKQNFVTIGGDMEERMRKLRAKFLLAGEGIKKIEAFYKRRTS